MQYDRSTADELDHYFRNKVGIAMLHYNGERISVDILLEEQKKFISGLEKAIEAKIPIFENIGYEQLEKMIEIGKKDWRDIKTIQELYSYYKEIRECKGYFKRTDSEFRRFLSS